MVQINIPLPQSNSKTVAPSDLAVMILKDGSVSVNGKTVAWAKLERSVAQNVRYADNKEKATVSIIAESGVTYDKIYKVMQIAAGLDLRAIMATAPKE